MAWIFFSDFKHRENIDYLEKCIIGAVEELQEQSLNEREVYFYERFISRWEDCRNNITPPEYE